MGMKDKSIRAFYSGNDLMSAPHNPKKNIVGTKICKDRAKTRRASRCVVIRPAAGTQVVQIEQDPRARGNFLLGF
jgi:hypothetical protein